MSVWAAETRAVIERYDADMRAAGLAEVWEHLLAQEDSPSRSMLLGVIGAVGAFLAETGFTPTSRIT